MKPMIDVRLLKKLTASTTWVLGLGLAQQGFADQISKLLPKQTAVAVETSDTGAFKKGDSLCFEDESKQKVGCGKVVKIGSGKIYVRFAKATYDKVSVGLNVIGKAAADDGDKTLTNDGFDSKPSDSKTATKSVAPKKVPSSLRLMYIAQMISPVTYANLTYDNKQNPSGNPWVADASTKSSLFGIGLEGRLGLNKAAIDLGLGYRTTAPSTIQSNYIGTTTSDDYLENVESLKAMRFWADYVKYIASGRSVGIPLKAGLDIDMSTVTFASSKKNDASGSSADFASATSAINIISLRLGGGIDWKLFGPVGINAGANLLIPLAQVGGSFSATTTDANYKSKPDQAQSDIQASIGHKKNTFGFEATIGAFAAF